MLERRGERPSPSHQASSLQPPASLRGNALSSSSSSSSDMIFIVGVSTFALRNAKLSSSCCREVPTRQYSPHPHDWVEQTNRGILCSFPSPESRLIEAVNPPISPIAHRPSPNTVSGQNRQTDRQTESEGCNVLAFSFLSMSSNGNASEAHALSDSLSHTQSLALHL